MQNALGRVDTNHINNKSELDECCEHDIEFFEAGEDASEAFESTEESFNFIAAFIERFVVFPRVDTI